MKSYKLVNLLCPVSKQSIFFSNQSELCLYFICTRSLSFLL